MVQAPVEPFAKGQYPQDAGQRKTNHTLEKFLDGTAITNDVDITGSVAPPKPWVSGVS
jgi:hypothetical protein